MNVIFLKANRHISYNKALKNQLTQQKDFCKCFNEF